MSRELEEIKAKVAASKVSSLFDNAEEVSGVKIASAYFTGTSGDTLRGMCDSIRDKAVNPCVAVLVGKTDDKITMLSPSISWHRKRASRLACWSRRSALSQAARAAASPTLQWLA